MPRGLLDPRRWLAPVALDRGPTALLIAAAVAVAVGGYEHARLFHQGYSEIATIGTLFVVNAVGSLLAILALLARRPLAFVAGSLAISAGSIVAIVLTRSSSGLFGFRESGYDGDALLTVAAEALAIVLTVAGAAMAGRTLLGGERGSRATRTSDGEASVRTVAAVALTVVLGGATLGIAQGGGQDESAGPSPVPAEATTTTPGDDGGEGSDDEQVSGAVSGAVADRGRELFGDRCAGCHRLADAGATGRIGPDLDRVLPGVAAAKVRESIVDPDAEITPGFSAGRMPSFADELSGEQLTELVDYLVAVTRGG